MTDKVQKIRKEVEKLHGNPYYMMAVKDVLAIISMQEGPVSEPNEQLAETYLAVFNEKFPILPSLSGKQLADYKNFLNKCQQIFGLKEWGIRPTQAKLFEKLSLLWAVWGAEHLQGVGRQDEKEQDIPISEDLEKASKEWLRPQLDKSYANYGEGKQMELTHFDGYAMLDAIEFGAKWQKAQEAKQPYFIEGYRQAEKDNELTWEDIREICRMWIESKTPFGVTGEALSIEVLKRFKEKKGENNYHG